MLETPFPFFIGKKPDEIPIFGTFLAKKWIFCQFWSMFTENPLFESGHAWKRHCDVIRWSIFMILVSMERGDPTLYHGTKQSYFGPVNFKFIRGVVTTPLGKPCYKKRHGRTRVRGVEWVHGLFLFPPFTFFSHQGKVTKIPSAHISLTYIHIFCSPYWPFCLTNFEKKKKQIYQIRFLFGMSPGVDSYSRHFGTINK